MKKNNPYLVIVLVIIIIILIIKSCIDKEHHTDDGDKPTHVPEKIISIQKGIDLFKEYDTTRTQLIEPELRRIYKDTNFVDTKFVWYSLEEIKEYIAYIEKVQKFNPSYDVTGLRIYFGAYSNDHPSIKYPNQQTFFMVPTMKVNKQDRVHTTMNHIPFAVQYKKASNPIKGTLIPIEELMFDYNKKERMQPYSRPSLQEGSFSFNITNPFSLLAPLEDVTSLVYNEGEMAPPPFESQVIDSPILEE